MDGIQSAASTSAGTRRSGEPGNAGVSRQGAFAGREVSVSHRQRRLQPHQAGREPAGGSNAPVCDDPTPTRPVKVLGAPIRASGLIEGWVSAPRTRPCAGSTIRVTPTPASPNPNRLWLTQERKDAIRKEDERLLKLVWRPDFPAEERAGLSATARTIRELERDSAEAHELLEKSRAGPLGDTDSRKLWSLVRLHQPGVLQRRIELYAAISRFRTDGGTCPTSDLVSDELRRRADDVCEYWYRMGLSWLGAATRIDTNLPVDLGSRTVVESRVVPGTEIGAHFPTGYPLREGHALPPLAEFPHARDLALTGLSNDRNETLFVGVRHGILSADDFQVEALQRLTYDELRAMLSNARAAGILQAPEGGTDESDFRNVCDGLSSPVFAPHAAVAMRVDFCNYMHVEILSTALLADPEKLQKAHGDKPVQLPLASIALLTPDDIGRWSTQHWYFDVESTGLPVALEVREPRVRKRLVPARVPIRQFALAIEGPLNKDIHRINRESAEQLLGPLNSPNLRGDVEKRLGEMRRRHETVSGVIPELEALHARIRARAGAGHPAEISARQSLARVQQEAVRLDRNVRSLSQAGSQLKVQWMRRGDWPVGDAALGTAALLALVGHLMCETPLMSCARGRDFTRRLDVEVKLLAAAADANDGRLPLIDAVMAGWHSARSAFTPPAPSVPAPAEHYAT